MSIREFFPFKLGVCAFWQEPAIPLEKMKCDPHVLTLIPALSHVPHEELSDQHIDPNQIEKYLGNERGIQGHQNSCYLDATVFGLFGLSDVFDSMFLKPSINPTEQEVSTILWKCIVNPLRR